MFVRNREMLTSSNSQRGNVANQTWLDFDLLIFFFSTEKTCQIFPPPRNGALACMTSEFYLHCAVMCSNGTDFEDTPPLLYYCSGGEWNYWKGLLTRYKNSNPWPNCSCKSFIIIFLLLPSSAQSSSIQRLIQLVSFFIRLILRLSPTEFFYLTKGTFFLA